VQGVESSNLSVPTNLIKELQTNFHFV
jgi:hypothetical protein